MTAKPVTDLTQERLARLGASMDTLAEAIASMTRLFALQSADTHGRLDRIENRLAGLETLVRGYASEQVSMANGLLNAEQLAARAHRRVDALEGST